MDIKNIKKRDFLRGFGMVSAGVVAAGDALAQPARNPDGGYPPGVPKATGRSMLDSPHYIGTASKGLWLQGELGPHPADGPNG